MNTPLNLHYPTVEFEQQRLEWRQENLLKPPLKAQTCQAGNANALLQTARAGVASVWTGDFHQAKQLLAAMKKRLNAKKQSNMPSAPLNSQQRAHLFHTHRMKMAQNSRLLNMLAVRVRPHLQLDLPRSPDVREALLDVYGEDNTHDFLLPLQQLLGLIGAYEWHKKGVDVAALSDKIHVPFGVFSPLRGEYLDLLAQARLPERMQTAWDIGTGSGVIAALLAKRGVPVVHATDNNPCALACAKHNAQRLGLIQHITFHQVDMFPVNVGQADLVVCNPPWLPAKPTSWIETALYDPEHQMLRTLLQQVGQYIRPQGELWLIMSDLAEHLGLRSPDGLSELFKQYRWQVLEVLHTPPKHSKAQDVQDPLAFARQKELTSLYRLQSLDVENTEK